MIVDNYDKPWFQGHNAAVQHVAYRVCVCAQVRNDAIADSLDLARRRIKKLEDVRQQAELRVEAAEVRGCCI